MVITKQVYSNDLKMNPILLKSKTSFDNLEVSQGSVVVLFPCKEEGKLKFVESHKESFEVYTQPCWIKLGELESGLLKHTKEVEKQWRSLIKYDALRESDRKDLKITKEFLRCVESSGRRILNLFYQKLIGQSFFEINLIMLSDIESFFDFLLEDVANHPQYTYILVQEINERFRLKCHPPFWITLSEDNKDSVATRIKSLCEYYRQEEDELNKLESEIINILGSLGVPEECYCEVSFVISDNDEPINETCVLKSRRYSFHDLACYIFYDNWGFLSQCEFEYYAYNRFDSIVVVHMEKRKAALDEKPILKMSRRNSLGHMETNIDVNRFRSKYFMFRLFLMSVCVRVKHFFNQ